MFTAAWRAREMEYNRQTTDDFIATDPTQIALIPRSKVTQPGGGYAMDDLPVKAVQTFRIIPATTTSDGIVVAEDGSERRYEFVLLGSFDADVKIGDHWVGATGQHWEVRGVTAFNGYEIKAGIHSFGGYPGYGG